MTLRSVFDVLMFASAIPAVLSVVVYAALYRWWASPIGRHLMSFTAVVAAVLALSVLRRWVGWPDWMPIVYVVVFSGVPIVLWWRLWVFVRTDARPPERLTLHAIDSSDDRPNEET